MWFYFLPRHVIMAMEYLHKLFHHIRVVAPKLVSCQFLSKENSQKETFFSNQTHKKQLRKPFSYGSCRNNFFLLSNFMFVSYYQQCELTDLVWVASIFQARPHTIHRKDTTHKIGQKLYLLLLLLLRFFSHFSKALLISLYMCRYISIKSLSFWKDNFENDKKLQVYYYLNNYLLGWPNSGRK